MSKDDDDGTGTITLHTDLMGVAHDMTTMGARSKLEAKFDSSVANNLNRY